jgi:hypothetical protein
MFEEPRHYPRKELEEAAQYAIDLSNLFLQLFKIAGIPVKGARYLEIGPGPDFAPQSVLASHGAEVTVADLYLAEWDAPFHREFYEVLMDKCTGKKPRSKRRCARTAMTACWRWSENLLNTCLRSNPKRLISCSRMPHSSM